MQTLGGSVHPRLHPDLVAVGPAQVLQGEEGIVEGAELVMRVGVGIDQTQGDLPPSGMTLELPEVVALDLH